MYSVTKRISMIKQPKGGYINRKNFVTNVLEDDIKLHEVENIHPSLVGLVVDYMTRFSMGALKEDAFHISIQGAKVAQDDFTAYKLLSKIKGVDHESIVSACKLVGYDVCVRSGMQGYKSVEEINPNVETINNIAIMIKRSINFWKEYGPIIKEGITFEGGYTSIISSGDGDYLTEDTLWDFKVSKREIEAKYTLQLLVYYIMGQHSVHKEFEKVKKLGIYNPRLNKVYLIDVCNIPKSVIDTVSRDVIGYGLSKEEVKKVVKASLAQRKSIKTNDNLPDLEKEIYGCSSKKGYISKAFPPEVKITDEAIYEGTPVFWSGETIPSIVFEKNLSYILRVRACFSIKKGKKPFVMNKTSFLYPLMEPLITSDIYNSKTGKYYSYYKDAQGKIVKSMPILTLTSADFKLFKEVYNVEEIEILDGCYFL